jgi:hypothetical protein
MLRRLLRSADLRREQVMTGRFAVLLPSCGVGAIWALRFDTEYVRLRPVRTRSFDRPPSAAHERRND